MSDWIELLIGQLGYLGIAFVCLGRVMPMVRSIVSIPAGLLNMPLGRFLIWSALGTTLWTAALTSAGYMLGQGYTMVADIVGPASLGIIALAALWYGWRVITWRR